MKILKLTIIGLIISQSVFAGYGKAIVGGAVGGVVAGVVTNAMSKNTNNTTNSTNSTYTEPSKGNSGSLVIKCYCMYGMSSGQAYGKTVIRCYKDKGDHYGRVVLHSGSDDIAVIPLTTYDKEYCEVV